MTLVCFELNQKKTKGVIRSILLDYIREHFSEKNKNAKNIQKHFQRKFGKTINTPQRTYCISKHGEFELGMFYDIVQFVKSCDESHKITLSDEFRQAVDTRYTYRDLDVHELPIKNTKPLREHQKECISNILKSGSGVCIHPTGTGKTLTIATHAHNLLVRKPQSKIMIVTLTHLCKQFVSDFLDYGIDQDDISMFGDGAKLNPNSKIVICGTTILTRNLEDYEKTHKSLKHRIAKISRSDSERFSDQQTKLDELQKELDMLEKNRHTLVEVQKYLRSVDCIIFDEVHSLRADNQINNVFDFVKTRHRFGYTATLPEDMEDIWNIKGKIGRVLHEKGRTEMVEKGIIADADIIVVNISYNSQPVYDFSMYSEPEYFESDIASEVSKLEKDKPKSPWNTELDFIAESEHRKNTTLKIVKKLNRNVLIVVDRINHGELLSKHLQDNSDKKVFFICGEVDSDEREKIRKLMESEDNIVCVAITRIFSTGINISNLHFIIFANSSVAKVTLIQAIGRGVRLHENKNKLLIFDFADRLHYGSRHLVKRLQIYKKEGFQVRHCNELESDFSKGTHETINTTSNQEREKTEA